MTLSLSLTAVIAATTLGASVMAVPLDVLRGGGCGPASSLRAVSAETANTETANTERVSAPTGGAEAVLAGMTRAQRIGQLIMVGTPATGADAGALTAVSTYHVGNVMLRGRSNGGVAATARVSAALSKRVTAAATDGVPLFVATDQEGGAVQVLRGSGFDAIPRALTQGTWTTAKLRTAAQAWGGQLRRAGVNLNLAPVLDTVPSAAAARLNPPIGVYSREFGYLPSVVTAHGLAVVQGMDAAGVDTAVKHFPGLGRVNANPDVSSGVTDRITTRTDAYLAPFAHAVAAGAPFLMMSTAYYSRIDPLHPAAFSKTVIRGMVRGDLGFAGVVISDDLANGRQVAKGSPGSRAVQFLAAGGDMVLTVNSALVPAMVAAVTKRAASDAAFAAQLDASALRVLQAKEARGLLPPALLPSASGRSVFCGAG